MASSQESHHSLQRSPFCEDETLVVTPSKEDPSEYSTYDLRNQ